MGKQRIIEIDIMRGIAIFLVVLGHAIIVFPINLHEIAWCNTLFVWLSSVHMPLFFLLAGFCYSMGSKGYEKYLIKKAKRLMVPYVLFCIFDMVVRVVFSDSVNHQRSIGESFENLIFSGGGYWFLYTLFIIFAIFPLIEKIFKKWGVAVPFSMVLLLVLSYINIVPEIFELNLVVRYLFYFIAGYLIKTNWMDFHRCKERMLKNRWLLLIVSCVIWYCCIEAILITDETIIWSFIASIVGMFAVWIVTTLIAKYNSTFLCDLSRYSLQLYLLNGYLLVISRTIIISILDVDSAVLIIVFNMFITLVFSWLVIKYILAQFKFSRFLLGIV